MKAFYEKVIAFFKKCWYVFFIPVGMFIISLFVSKKTAVSTKPLEKEIKKDTSSIKDQKKEVSKANEDINIAVEDTKETITENLAKKEIRDQEAKKFFGDNI